MAKKKLNGHQVGSAKPVHPTWVVQVKPSTTTDGKCHRYEVVAKIAYEAFQLASPKRGDLPVPFSEVDIYVKGTR